VELDDPDARRADDLRVEPLADVVPLKRLPERRVRRFQVAVLLGEDEPKIGA